MAGELPKPLSYPQIYGDMLRSLTADTKIRRFRTGGPLLSIIEAAARMDARDLAHIYGAVEARDLGNATGQLLAGLGAESDTDPLPSESATTQLDFGDSSFAKVSSSVYRGLPAPVSGSVTINVDDANDAPASGTIYIGRGTSRVEGPLAYASKTHASGYWTFNLSSPTVNFHNWGEEVVIGHGGDRVVDVGMIVQTPPSTLNTPVQFSVTAKRILLDGETALAGVPAVCTQKGSVGNVPDGALSAFAGSPPWPGATVTNPEVVTDGRDVEDDDSYRERIRARNGSRQRGTDLAIEQAVRGQKAVDEARTVSSAQLVRRLGLPSLLFIDDGTGYEALTKGVAIEVLASRAAGGEIEFQTEHRPIAQAALVTAEDGPYPLQPGSVLSVLVGTEVSEHRFREDQVTAGAATAYEVSASVNSDPECLFSARTIGGGKRVVLEARAEERDDLEVSVPSGGEEDANGALEFQQDRTFTTNLYLNDRPLVKDGFRARLYGPGFANWADFTGPQDIVISIDGTPSATYTATDQQFVDAGTEYSAVGRNTPQAWAAVLDRLIPGVTVTVDGDRLVLTSNREDDRASVEVFDCDLVGQGMLTVGESQGSEADYSLDRSTGELRLAKQLAAGDRLTLGTFWGGAFIESTDVPTSDLPLGGKVWLAVDGATELIPVGVIASPTMTASVLRVEPHAYQIALTASGPQSFGDVLAGDWVVVADSAAPSSLRQAWRVVEVRKDGNNFLNTLVFEKVTSRVPRVAHRATLLQPSGGTQMILVTGGYSTATGLDAGHVAGRGATSECELYDPAYGIWRRAAPMATPRAYHTATLLQDGRVLVAGGENGTGPLATTEIYDPVADSWTAGPQMSTSVSLHAAVLLNSGRVLICGGRTIGGVTAVASEYDPSTGLLTNTTTMVLGRWGHQLVLLPPGAGTAGAEAGNVLCIGGHISPTIRTATTERYSVSAITWTAKASMPAPVSGDASRASFGATWVDTQTVMVVGDEASSSSNAATWALYSVNTDSWGLNLLLPGTCLFVHKDVARMAGGAILAPYALASVPTDPIQPQRHLRFSAGVWSTVTDSAAFASDHHRLGVVPVAVGSINRVACIGGVSVENFPTATTSENLMITCAAPEVWDDSAGWQYPDPVVGSWTPLDAGVSVARTASDLLLVQIPVGTGYTANTLAELLAASVEQASATTYRTRSIRWQSNTRGGGDISVVASTVKSQLPFPAGVEHGREQEGASLSTNPSRTPWGFQVYHAYGVDDGSQDSGLALHVTEPNRLAPLSPTLQLYESELPPPMGGTAAAISRWHDGPNPTYWAFAPRVPLIAGADPRIPEQGLRGWRSDVSTWSLVGDVLGGLSNDAVIGVEEAPQLAMCPHQPLVFETVRALRPGDELSLIVDEDAKVGRFDVPAARLTKPVGVYSQQISLRDGDGTNALWVPFGKAYDWNGFAVHMRARGKTHDSDDSRRILWRYYRTGPEGELVVVRYDYATGPSAAVSTRVTLDQTSPTEDLKGRVRAFVDVLLPSGAARTATVPVDQRLAIAHSLPTSSDGYVRDAYYFLGFEVAAAERASAGGPTKLTVTVPNGGIVANGPQGTGITAGQTLWFEAASPDAATLTSGFFVVDSVDPFDTGTGTQFIYIPANTLHNGTAGLFTTPNPGSLTLSALSKGNWDGAMVAGDLVRGGSGLPSSYANRTARVISSGPRYIRARIVDPTGLGADSVPVQYDYTNNVSVFRGSTGTATSVAAAVTALAALENSSCPLTGVATGTGSGTLTLASWDEADSATSGVKLTDGLNYVQRTIPAVLNTDETQVLLRAAINSTLSTNSDWTNEQVWLVPCLPRQLARWMNTPATTGLSTMASVAVAEGGRSVRVESLTPGSSGSVRVLGGSSNEVVAEVAGAARAVLRNAGQPQTAIVTVRGTRAGAIGGDSWVEVEHGEVVKSPPFFSVSTTATIASTGRWTFSPAPYTVTNDLDNIRVHFDVVGDYVAVIIPKGENPSCPLPTDGEEWGYAYICQETGIGVSASPAALLPDVSQANRGVFQIVRYCTTPYGATIWIKNPEGVGEVSLARIKLLPAAAPVPGDTWIVNTDKFGAANNGTWTVVEVGSTTPGGIQYQDGSFTVRALGKVPSSLTVATAFVEATGSCQLRRAAGSLVKRVLTITPNQDDPSFTDIQLDTAAGIQAISSTAGGLVRSLDKLGFSTALAKGIDGYQYHAGLLGQATRVVYGDPSDEVTYPGYAAEGSRIVPTPPKIRRVTLALGARVTSGASFSDVADRIRAEATAAVNQTPQGQGCSFTSIDGRCKGIPGLEAMSFSSPEFSVASDEIPCGPGEKLRVIDPPRDVTVLQVGVDSA